MPRTTIKGQVHVDLIAKFSPWVVSPKQENLASAHRREESLEAKLFETQPNETQSAKEKNEPIKEPSTILKATKIEKIVEVLEVVIEPP